MTSFKTLLIGLTAALAFAAPVSAATLVNGSLTGPVATGTVPTGWTVTSPSPDTNDLTNNLGGFLGYAATASNSSDGGTWVGFGVEGATNEQLGQTISDFVIGTDYTLSFEAANFGIAGLSQFGANAITATLGGVAIGTTNVLAVAEGWTSYAFDFTATSVSALLNFGLATNDSAYLQIDGISLTAASIDPVPLPAGLVLMLSALGGMSVLRRRARA